jgi:hypothetical protein
MTSERENSIIFYNIKRKYIAIDSDQFHISIQENIQDYM